MKRIRTNPLKRMSRRTRILLAVFALLLCLILPGFGCGLRVAHYAVPAEGLGAAVRIALVTDLHSCAYGEGQRELLDAIDAENPDLILLGGDIFDDDLPDDNALAFLRGIGSRYPCYYVTGNHEYWSGAESFARKMAALEACGIVRLSGAAAEAEIGGVRLRVCGVDDPDAWEDPDIWEDPVGAPAGFLEQLARVTPAAEDGTFTILLTHRPELFDLYAGSGFGLVLAGHAHGGHWRIPGLLNGLWAPNQGFFPALAGGRYERGGTVMIVSRGLARESTPVPRFYNRPELVIVDLIPE